MCGIVRSEKRFLIMSLTWISSPGLGILIEDNACEHGNYGAIVKMSLTFK